MPIFTKSIQNVDYSNPTEALRKMVGHIRYIQEQLEYTLMNLDSRNVTEIDTDVTNITDTTGSTSIGSYISLNGNNGESFSAGKSANGTFEFTVKGRNGLQTMYLDSSGGLIITKNTNISIDCGEW